MPGHSLSYPGREGGAGPEEAQKWRADNTVLLILTSKEVDLDRWEDFKGHHAQAVILSKLVDCW